MPEFIVGVDSGATHTVAALGRRADVIRTVDGEPANARVVGIERAANAIAQTVRQLLNGETAAAIAVGAAGLGNDEMRHALRSALAIAFPNARIAVTADAHIALRAAIPEGDGIVLIAGTGSIAYASCAGRAYRAGGYGYLIGDEGSGYAIGAAALRLLLQAMDDNAPRDPLLEELAAHISAHSRADVIARLYESRTPVTDIAACAAIVLRHAGHGLIDALKIVEQAAAALYALVFRVLSCHPDHSCHPERSRRTNEMSSRAESRGEGWPLAFSGGLLFEDNVLSDLLQARIHTELPHLRLIKKRAAPYLGALAEARRLLEERT